MAPSYANGKVYCIRDRSDGDKMVYVGSTIRTLSERMSSHRRDIKNHPHLKLYKRMVEKGVGNFHIELLQDFPCENKDQLRKAEGDAIRANNMIDAGCNEKLAGRSMKEWMAEHREELNEKQKVYVENNKDKVFVQRKNYREKHSADIAVRMNAYYQAHREQAILKAKVYYTANREKINEQKRARRQAKKMSQTVVEVTPTGNDD